MGHFRDFFDGDAMTIGKEGPAQISVSWSTVVSGLVVLAGLMTWAITKAINSDNTSASVRELRTEMVEGFKSIREQVAGLPTQAATLKQVDERGRELIVNLNSVAQSLAATDRSAYEAGQAARRLEQQFDQRMGRVEQRLDRVEQQINHPVPLRDTR